MPDSNETRIRSREFIEVVPPPPPAIEQSSLRVRSPRPTPTPDLGRLQPLLGIWRASGTGWNMIALPFQDAPASPAGFKFRVLMNQYNEELQVTFVDSNVPNRGLLRTGSNASDQFTVTLDYQQKISQVLAEDRPDSNGLAGPPGLPIHHEPGLWLYAKNNRAKDDHIKGDVVSQVKLDVARLASIPHGNSLLALGTSEIHQGMPEIPPLNAIPAGRFEDVSTPDYDFKSDPYLEPFKHYIDSPFMGNVTPAQAPGFPGFNPADMNQILRFANQGLDVVKTTTLTVDTARQSGGISSVPFSVREAEPVSMKSTFWIQELREKDAHGQPKMRLQYSQVVMLEFFNPRQDEFPGRAVWPHVSIATLERVPAEYKLVAG